MQGIWRTRRWRPPSCNWISRDLRLSWTHCRSLRLQKPIGTIANAAHRQVSLYRIPVHEFFAKIHRDVSPTRFWGYGNSLPGPTIEARSGDEIAIEWSNNLPAKHFLPIDHTY